MSHKFNDNMLKLSIITKGNWEEGNILDFYVYYRVRRLEIEAS